MTEQARERERERERENKRERMREREKERVCVYQLKIVVTYFHNLQISMFISNSLSCINGTFQINAPRLKSVIIILNCVCDVSTTMIVFTSLPTSMSLCVLLVSKNGF